MAPPPPSPRPRCSATASLPAPPLQRHRLPPGAPAAAPLPPSPRPHCSTDAALAHPRSRLPSALVTRAPPRRSGHGSGHAAAVRRRIQPRCTAQAPGSSAAVPQRCPGDCPQPPPTPLVLAPRAATWIRRAAHTLTSTSPSAPLACLQHWLCAAQQSTPPTPPTPSHLPDQVAAPLVVVSSSPAAAPPRPQRNHSSGSRSMESGDHGRAARRHEMWFSAPVGVVHERAGDDGSKAVHSGSCRGALWWPLWYSSVAGQLGDATGAVS
ncbi:hypothetical protein VPH35_045934 [Triticum aestivum]|uniref:vegetative cell wall protein gp1 isoform X2 n=1 Tax=Triticum aestivum TaxID=4565 RepID=UPI001D00382C|nr:vegetative cell wall protein gp1-like isoform X2 [Triticum aestivum]